MAWPLCQVAVPSCCARCKRGDGETNIANLSSDTLRQSSVLEAGKKVGKSRVFILQNFKNFFVVSPR